MKRSKIPPLGPKPKFIYEWERIKELQAAFRRAIEANYPLREEDVSEYNDLVLRLEIDEYEKG